MEDSHQVPPNERIEDLANQVFSLVGARIVENLEARRLACQWWCWSPISFLFQSHQDPGQSDCLYAIIANFQLFGTSFTRKDHIVYAFAPHRYEFLRESPAILRLDFL